MNKKLIVPTIVIVAVLAAVWIYDAPGKKYHHIHGDTQGTTYNLTFEYRDNVDLSQEIEQLLYKFDLSLSTYDPQSIISQINNNEDVEVDQLFIDVFKEAQRVNQLSQGAFDITVGPVVNAWGFGSAPGIDTIDSIVIDSLLQCVGMQKVRLNGNRVVKDNPCVRLDVNAIAQGYSVDVVVEYLEAKEIDNYLVEIGGELRCKGKNPKGEDWKIGIDRPIDGNMMPGANMQAIVAVKGKSLATSGNYRKFYEKNGVKYAHSINPKTGYPVLSRLLSATVISDKCMTADAFATSFMVMGLEKSIAYLANQTELDAYLIFSDEEGNFKVHATPGMSKYIIKERE